MYKEAPDWYGEAAQSIAPVMALFMLVIQYGLASHGVSSDGFFSL